MKVPEAIEIAVESIEMTVEHVTGTATAGMIIGCTEAIGVVAELMNGIQNGLVQLVTVLVSSQLQDSELVDKSVVAALLVSIPDFLGDFRKDGGKPLGTVTNLQEGVKEAQDDDGTRKQALPGSLGRGPAIYTTNVIESLWDD